MSKENPVPKAERVFFDEKGKTPQEAGFPVVTVYRHNVFFAKDEQAVKAAVSEQEITRALIKSFVIYIVLLAATLIRGFSLMGLMPPEEYKTAMVFGGIYLIIVTAIVGVITVFVAIYCRRCQKQHKGKILAVDVIEAL